MMMKTTHENCHCTEVLVLVIIVACLFASDHIHAAHIDALAREFYNSLGMYYGSS